MAVDSDSPGKDEPGALTRNQHVWQHNGRAGSSRLSARICARIDPILLLHRVSAEFSLNLPFTLVRQLSFEAKSDPVKTA